jgi:type III secretion protein V
VIGVLQRGMDLGSAARTYTLLTIGEGLVAQIPALIISTAAGIVVTRVSSDREGSHLGSEIAEQVLAQPRALAVSAALLALLALVPGLPAVPFLVLAAVLGLVAYRIVRGSQEREADDAWQVSQAAEESELLPPLCLDLCPGFGKEAKARLGRELLPRLRERFFAETGIPIPMVRMREASDLRHGAFAIRVHEAVVESGEVPSGGAGGNPEEDVARHLLQALRRHGHLLVGVEEAQALLDRLARTHPNLVREVVPKLLSVVLLAEILQCLAKEGISLRYLAQVLSALAKRVPLRGNAPELAEAVRASLQRQMTSKFAAPDGRVPVYLLDPTIEETLREAIQKGESGSYLALEPELGRDVVESVGRAVKGAKAPVIVTGADIRRHLRGLIENDHPQVAVLSYQDLLPEAKLATQGRISIEG